MNHIELEGSIDAIARAIEEIRAQGYRVVGDAALKVTLSGDFGRRFLQLDFDREGLATFSQSAVTPASLMALAKSWPVPMRPSAESKYGDWLNDRLKQAEAVLIGLDFDTVQMMPLRAEDLLVAQAPMQGEIIGQFFVELRKGVLMQGAGVVLVGEGGTRASVVPIEDVRSSGPES